MAVISVEEERRGRTATLNEKNERSYTRTFIVETDDPTTDQVPVGNAAGIFIGDAFPSDPGALCKTVNVSCHSDDGTLWHVTYNYGPMDDDDTNPLNEPAEITVSFENYPTPVDRTIDGKPIVASNGLPFADPVMKDEKRPVIEITENVASFSIATAWAYANAVNASVWQGIPAGRAKVMVISAQRQFDQEYGFYWRQTISVAVQAQGWEAIVMDQGMHEFDAAGELKRITNKNAPVNEPVPLNGAGKKLAVGDPYHWHKFKLYPTLPFPF